ncbi:hypothetical protein JX266_008275 [Neoarthrinium moseri]|nr:hypothetical protein JX266_008275 [Neoarthrinium moseri]
MPPKRQATHMSLVKSPGGSVRLSQQAVSTLSTQTNPRSSSPGSSIKFGGDKSDTSMGHNPSDDVDESEAEIRVGGYTSSTKAVPTTDSSPGARSNNTWTLDARTLLEDTMPIPQEVPDMAALRSTPPSFLRDGIEEMRSPEEILDIEQQRSFQAENEADGDAANMEEDNQYASLEEEDVDISDYQDDSEARSEGEESYHPSKAEATRSKKGVASKAVAPRQAKKAATTTKPKGATKRPVARNTRAGKTPARQNSDEDGSVDNKGAAPGPNMARKIYQKRAVNVTVEKVVPSTQAQDGARTKTSARRAAKKSFLDDADEILAEDSQLAAAKAAAEARTASKSTGNWAPESKQHNSVQCPKVPDSEHKTKTIDGRPDDVYDIELSPDPPKSRSQPGELPTKAPANKRAQKPSVNDTARPTRGGGRAVRGGRGGRGGRVSRGRQKSQPMAQLETTTEDLEVEDLKEAGNEDRIPSPNSKKKRGPAVNGSKSQKASAAERPPGKVQSKPDIVHFDPHVGAMRPVQSDEDQAAEDEPLQGSDALMDDNIQDDDEGLQIDEEAEFQHNKTLSTRADSPQENRSPAPRKAPEDAPSNMSGEPSNKLPFRRRRSARTSLIDDKTEFVDADSLEEKNSNDEYPRAGNKSNTPAIMEANADGQDYPEINLESPKALKRKRGLAADNEKPSEAKKRKKQSEHQGTPARPLENEAPAAPQPQRQISISNTGSPIKVPVLQHLLDKEGPIPVQLDTQPRKASETLQISDDSPSSGDASSVGADAPTLTLPTDNNGHVKSRHAADSNIGHIGHTLREKVDKASQGSHAKENTQKLPSDFNYPQVRRTNQRQPLAEIELPSSNGQEKDVLQTSKPNAQLQIGNSDRSALNPVANGPVPHIPFPSNQVLFQQIQSKQRNNDLVGAKFSGKEPLDSGEDRPTYSQQNHQNANNDVFTHYNAGPSRRNLFYPSDLPHEVEEHTGHQSSQSAHPRSQAFEKRLADERQFARASHAQKSEDNGSSGDKLPGFRMERGDVMADMHPKSQVFANGLLQSEQSRENHRMVGAYGHSGTFDVGRSYRHTKVTNEAHNSQRRWKTAVDASSRGLADTMHDITVVMLRHLSSKEDAIVKVPVEYRQNGKKIISSLLQRQHKERKNTFDSFEQGCRRLLQIYDDAFKATKAAKEGLSSRRMRIVELVKQKQDRLLTVQQVIQKARDDINKA